MFDFMVWFGGVALVYAAALSIAVCLGMRVFVGRIHWPVMPLVFTTAFFVFLTQHPFPSPGELECPVPSAAPKLRPLDFLTHMARLYELGKPFTDWLQSRWVMAALMNFFLCVVIGFLWATQVRGKLAAALFGFALSLSCELTQLTGLWGLYDCAYRSFNVDDLLLNTLGVVTGHALHGLLARRYG